MEMLVFKYHSVLISRILFEVSSEILLGWGAKAVYILVIDQKGLVASIIV
jgi:hypothetical protein